MRISMRKLMHVMMAVCALDAATTVASARVHRLAEAQGLPPLEAHGCYWYRQHLFCGRYCYTEIDGRRYCREDKREAVPQAP